MPEIVVISKFANRKLGIFSKVISKPAVQVFCRSYIVIIIWNLMLCYIYTVGNNGLLIFVTQFLNVVYLQLYCSVFHDTFFIAQFPNLSHYHFHLLYL